MEPVNPTSPIEQQPRFIPWEEQLQDHTRKLEEYLQNLLFRGCTLETTIRSSRAVLNHLFDRLQIKDPTHPRGIRQLLVWDLLDPGFGSSWLGSLISLLVQDNLAHGTRRKYIRELRSFCDYVLAKPNIPGSAVLTISEKYGPITQTFTKYDVPMHVQDILTQPRYAYPLRCGTNFTSSCGPNTCRSMRHLIAVHETTRPLSFKPRSACVQVSCWEYGRAEKAAT